MAGWLSKSVVAPDQGESSARRVRRGMTLIRLGLLAAGISFAVAVASSRAAEPSCLACHEDQAGPHATSAHARAGISCVDCHGGNPKAEDIEAHLTDDFHRPENKQQIAESCARCHSDVRRMNPYGLPTDQLERYKTSRHGEKLFGEGDQRVAGCTDCHGVHDILKPDSPDSRVHPRNIPQMCGSCHSDAKLMRSYGLPSDVVDEYRKSHHATMLFDHGDLTAPTCVTCHGNHGAMPPGTVEVGQVCGQCHGRERDLFEKSPHAELAREGLHGGCKSCHGNHAIRKASVKLFDRACTECHAEGDEGLARRDALVALIEKYQDAQARAEKMLHEAEIHGLETDDEQLLLQEISTAVTQLEALQHTLQVAELEPVAARAEEMTDRLESDLNRMYRIEQWKRLALMPIFSFLAIMALLLAFKRLLLDMQRKRK
jgi:hypothetical protein